MNRSPVRVRLSAPVSLPAHKGWQFFISLRVGSSAAYRVEDGGCVGRAAASRESLALLLVKDAVEEENPSLVRILLKTCRLH